MSYKVTMSDKSEIIIPTEAGQILMDQLSGPKPPTHITIGGEYYRASAVVSIKKSSLGEVSDAPQISAPANGCRAEHSIEREVMMLTRKLHPTDWPKYLRDEKYRNRMRFQIRKKFPDKKWCDSKRGECACEKLTAKAQAQ